MSSFLIPFSIYKKIGAYIPSVVVDFCKDQDFHVQILHSTPDNPDVKLAVNGGFLNTEIGYIPIEKEKLREKLREAKRESFSEEFAFWTKGAVVTSYSFDGDVADISEWRASFTYLATSGKTYSREIISPSFYHD